MKIGVVQTSGAEENVFTPLCMVSHREKGTLLMACVGPLCRQVKKDETIAGMLFY